MGRADPSRGNDDPTLRKLVELLGRGTFWVMLSLTEKLSRQGFPWDDVVPVAQACIQAASDRVVWGSDWPHPVSTKAPTEIGRASGRERRWQEGEISGVAVPLKKKN